MSYLTFHNTGIVSKHSTKISRISLKYFHATASKVVNKKAFQAFVESTLI